ncbi:hypothetical protein Btru_048307 [Bulinus truncatus]|nr:hypothetical protein Btru_048307 [Bulinus truncatus]
MDIHCDRAVVVYNITLRGDAVPFMCSVYVTGGRNLALHQLSAQSSLYSDSFCDESCSLPQNAVDGKTTSNLYSKSCTHTTVEDKPWWKVGFLRPYLINKYRLFNRYPYSSRLKLFNIVSWSSSRITFNYTDEGNNDSLNYTVIHSPTSLNIPVTSVVITSFNKAKILTICEFEAFGETICLNRTYGRDCENLCKCRNRTESCLVSTGGCMTGCDDGYIGGGCNTACEPTYFGNGCKQKCDERCLNQLCENIKGHCLECLPGRIGRLCEKSCPPFTYGPSCSKNCSLYCGGVGHCDPATGVCSSGCRDGYIGALCTEECDNSTYGSNCSLSCSPYCNMDVSISSDICHHFNGYCVHGCQPGYDGWQCNRDCLPPFYGFNCRELCSVNCFDQACNSTTGLCLDCLPGKIGDMCEEECQPSYYGQDCLHRCNIGCMEQLCNSTNGYCLKCPELKSEVTMHERLNLRCNLTNGQYFCVSEMEESNTKNCHGKNVAVIVLATFVGASLAGAIVVIIILWRKYHIGSKYFLCLFKLKSNDSTADQETFVFQQDCNDT